MNQAVNQNLLELLRSSSAETREAVFEELLRELMANAPDAKSLPLHDSKGELLGFFVLPATALPDDMPPFTPEEEEEHQRRLASIDREIDSDELTRRLTRRKPVESGSRRP